MEKNQSGKGIRARVSALALTASAAILVMAVIGGVCLTRIVNTAQNSIDTTMGKSAYLRQVEVAFAKTQLTLEGYVFHRDPEGIREETTAELALLSGQILSASDHFYSLSQLDGVSQELSLYKAYIERFQHYQLLALELTDKMAANDREKIEILFEEASALGEECTAFLQHLNEMYQSQLAEFHSLLQARTVVTIIILIASTIAFILILLVLQFSVFAGIKQAENEGFECSPAETSSADSSKGMLAEFDKRLAELKAVAYDLTRLTKDSDNSRR